MSLQEEYLQAVEARERLRMRDHEREPMTYRDATKPLAGGKATKSHLTHQGMKHLWAGESCTLNGEPAIISGRLERFASVRTLDGRMNTVRTWTSVDRIMRDDQAFTAH